MEPVFLHGVQRVVVIEDDIAPTLVSVDTTAANAQHVDNATVCLQAAVMDEADVSVCNN